MKLIVQVIAGFPRSVALLDMKSGRIAWVRRRDILSRSELEVGSTITVTVPDEVAERSGWAEARRD